MQQLLDERVYLVKLLVIHHERRLVTKHVFSLLIRVNAPAIVIAPDDERYQEILTSSSFSLQNANLSQG